MPSFQYRAYDASGRFAQGSVEAASQDAASDSLWARGLTPLQVTSSGPSAKPWWQREVFGGRRALRSDLVAFTAELATFIGAEIALDDALRLLSDQATSAGMAELAAQLRKDVLNGATLSDAMAKRPGVFSADYVSVVRAGETGGTLGQVFEELATLLERRLEVHTKVRSALIYPAILVGLSSISLVIIVGVLMPSIAPVFAGGGRPLPAAIQFFLALQANWLEVAIAVTAAVAIVVTIASAALRRPLLRMLLDRAKVQAPVLAGFLLAQETARFARTLGTLLRAGVPLLRAATSACEVVGNRHVAAGIARAIGLLQEGASLHHALARETVLPVVALRMISVGEEAGKLDRMLLAVAGKFEQQTQRSIDRFMTALTPLLTMTIAVLVGGLIMVVMNAILSVNELTVR
jgi:general secretion pathway protein F